MRTPLRYGAGSFVWASLIALLACRSPLPNGSLGNGARDEIYRLAPDQGAISQATIEEGLSLRSNSSDPSIDAVTPTNGGPGVVVVIHGRGLAGEGTQVRFGGVTAASLSVQTDGSLQAVVPEGARSGHLEVRYGALRASRPFRVIAHLQIGFPNGATTESGRAMSIAVTALDTEGIIVPDPFYRLEIIPPQAAQVVSQTSIIPRSEGSFQVQVHSGGPSKIALAVGCSRFSLTPFAGDGIPGFFVRGQPVLTRMSTESNGFAELGTADEAHLTRPWGLATINHPNVGEGLLIADSLIGRIRFVPFSGGTIKTVLGGGKTPATAAGETVVDKDGKPRIDLIEPADLAVGRDWDERTVVLVVERGRHQILMWNPASGSVQVIAGKGAPSATRLNSATDSVLVQSEGLGDRNDQKKICGEPTAATFWDPSGISLSHIGNKQSVILIADTNNQRIRRVRRFAPEIASTEFKNRNCDTTGIKPTGEITTVVGTGKAGTAALGDAASSSIDTPLDVTAHPEPIALGQGVDFKKAFVADTNNNQLLMVEGLFDVAGAPAISKIIRKNFDHPSGLHFNPRTRKLLIADTLNNRVVRYDELADAVLEAATCSLLTNPSDGLVWPRGITTRNQGTNFPAFVSDFFSHQVRILEADIPD